MKKEVYKSLLLLAAVLTLQTGFSQEKEKWAEPKFKKTKSYSKSYALSSSDKVNLSNQFGEMKLVTWEKNEIKVDITITGKANVEARAQEILDKISILDSKTGNTVSFKTKFADDKWNNDNDNNHKSDNKNKNQNRNENHNENNNEGMDIDYMVYLPSGTALTADNQFGKMIVPDYRGEANLSSKFGSLTAGKISNAKEVTVEFGEANIASITGGDLNIKFSHGTVNNLDGNVNTDVQFSQVKLVVDNSAKSLTVNNSYSTVYLDLDKSFSATYDISTSHGSFTNKTSFPIKRQGDDDDKRGYGPRFNERYTGTSGGGGAKVRVSSSFGEVVAGHNLQVDLTEKKKNKSTKVI